MQLSVKIEALHYSSAAVLIANLIWLSERETSIPW